MSDRPSGDEVRILQENRAFVQFGGAKPDSPARYYGQGTNYNIFQAVTIAKNGAVTPHWTGDPNVLNAYRLIARTIAPPPLSNFTMHMLEKRGTLSKMLAQDCPFTGYNLAGGCGDPSSILYGWQGGLLEIYADAILGSINGGNRAAWQDNAPIIDQIPGTTREIYMIGPVGFAPILSSDIAVEVLDTVYGNQQQCGGCGRANNGTGWQYAVQKFSGSNEASLLYRTVNDDGTEIASGVLDITGIGASADPSAVDVAGQYIIVTVPGDNAYFYATINQQTGIPGAFTKVTGGFVAAKTPNDIFVYNQNEIFIVGNGGYIYKLPRVGADVQVVSAGDVTTENLARVHGLGNTLVAVGANGVVLKSINRGVTWALTDDEPGVDGGGLAVAVVSDTNFWYGNDDGELWYTEDGGASWIEAPLSDSPTAIRDIAFATKEVMWVVGENATGGVIYYSPDGGADISTANSAPRMQGVSQTGFQKANRIAVPTAGNSFIGANAALVAGLGLTTDGIWLAGYANFF